MSTPIDKYLKPPFTSAKDTGFTWHGADIYEAIPDKFIFIGPPKYYAVHKGQVIELAAPDCYDILEAINKATNYADNEEE